MTDYRKPDDFVERWYFHDPDTGMEYWHDGEMTRGQCHDGVGLMTYHTQSFDDFMEMCPGADALAQYVLAEVGYDIEVCTDCYFAHHYGWREPYPGQFTTGPDFTLTRDVKTEQPLALVPDDAELSDNTCSNHAVDQIEQDELTEQDTTTCEHCGQWGYDNGITDFSSSPCRGCGSHLGGSRYRLRVTIKEEQHG